MSTTTTKTDNLDLTGTGEKTTDHTSSHSETTTTTTITTTTTPSNIDNNHNEGEDNANKNNTASSGQEEKIILSKEELQDEKDVLRRVKLYHLKDDGKWCDKGTGHVHTEVLQSKGGTCLVMISEEDDSVLLESKISQEDIYQLQGESLIVWCDRETSIDMALSFQESEGCQQVWDEIRIFQGRLPDSKEIIKKNLLEEKENEEGEEDISSTEESHQPFELPTPEIRNLQKILDSLSSVSKTRASKALLENDYLEGLFDIFEKCEDLEDLESCRILFSIFKTINDYLIKVMGILEYDIEMPPPKANHREYLTRTVIFKEVIPFTKRDIVQKIHQTFRIQYLKDSVLPRVLDDQTFNTLNNLIYFNNVDIIKSIREDTAFLKLFFNELKEEKTIPRKRDFLKFLQEYNNMLKVVQTYVKGPAYTTLIECGLLEILENSFVEQDESIRHSTSDIVCAIIYHDSTIIRTFICNEYKEQKKTFLKNFIRGIIEETELGVQDNLTEALKTLLDPDSLGSQKDEFLNLFYQDFLDILILPLTDKSVGTKEAKVHVLELLSYCVQQHAYRSKNYILRHNVMHKAVECIKTTEKDLILAVVRFIRSCVALIDIFYNTNIIQNDLFDPIMEVWRSNADKYNLINSAIIELFEFIKNNNIKKLIIHAVEKYRTDFENAIQIETFQSLIEKFEEIKKSGAYTYGSSLSLHRNRSSSEENDNDDESYFKERGNGKTSLESISGYGSDEEKKSPTEETATGIVPSISLPSVKKTQQEDDEDDAIFNIVNTNQHNESPAGHSSPITINLNSTKKQEQQQHPADDDNHNKKRSLTELYDEANPTNDAVQNNGTQQSPTATTTTLLSENRCEIDTSSVDAKKRRISPERDSNKT